MIQEEDKNNFSIQQALKSEIFSGQWLREGMVVEVELAKKLARELYFNVGKFGTGIVYGLEFLNAKDIIRNLKVGDRLPAKIVSLDGEGGCIELSLVEANKQKFWQQAKELEESGEVIKVRAFGANPAGLLVSFPDSDLKGFLPVSQLLNDHYPKVDDGDSQKVLEELKKLIGQEFEVKVIEVNPQSNKLIVSERETASINVKEALSHYQVGQVVEGIVSGIANFGVFIRFVDNPEIEGLVHISELDHRLIDNPKDVVSINESVKVKIIDIRDGRVFLSIKALKPDPWERIGEKITMGSEIKGKIFKFNPFGAIVDLEGGFQGVIHISEFGGVEEMKKTLTLGQTYQFTVIAIKPEEKRIILKLKR